MEEEFQVSPFDPLPIGKGFPFETKKQTPVSNILWLLPSFLKAKPDKQNNIYVANLVWFLAFVLTRGICTCLFFFSFLILMGLSEFIIF